MGPEEGSYDGPNSESREHAGDVTGRGEGNSAGEDAAAHSDVELVSPGQGEGRRAQDALQGRSKKSTRDEKIN